MTYITLKRVIFLLMNILFFNSYLVLGQTCYSTCNARVQYYLDKTNSLGAPYQVSKEVHNYTIRFTNVISDSKFNSCCESCSGLLN